MKNGKLNITKKRTQNEAVTFAALNVDAVFEQANSTFVKVSSRNDDINAVGIGDQGLFVVQFSANTLVTVKGTTVDIVVTD